MQTFDSIYFRGKNHFKEKGAQNYVEFQPIYRYFKRVAGVRRGSDIHFWKSKELSYERINCISASNDNITPELSYYASEIRVKFNGSCFKQDKITYVCAKTVNICIIYEISKNFNISSYSTLENCFFGAVSVAENNDIDSIIFWIWYWIGFGENCIIFGVGMSFSVQEKTFFKFWWRSYTYIRWHKIKCRKEYSSNFTENKDSA